RCLRTSSLRSHFVHCSPVHPVLHSFPTRRSSDLSVFGGHEDCPFGCALLVGAVGPADARAPERSPAGWRPSSEASTPESSREPAKLDHTSASPSARSESGGNESCSDARSGGWLSWASSPSAPAGAPSASPPGPARCPVAPCASELSCSSQRRSEPCSSAPPLAWRR